MRMHTCIHARGARSRRLVVRVGHVELLPRLRDAAGDARADREAQLAAAVARAHVELLTLGVDEEDVRPVDGDGGAQPLAHVPAAVRTPTRGTGRARARSSHAMAG